MLRNLCSPKAEENYSRAGKSLILGIKRILCRLSNQILTIKEVEEHYAIVKIKIGMKDKTFPISAEKNEKIKWLRQR